MRDRRIQDLLAPCKLKSKKTMEKGNSLVPLKKELYRSKIRELPEWRHHSSSDRNDLAVGAKEPFWLDNRRELNLQPKYPEEQRLPRIESYTNIKILRDFPSLHYTLHSTLYELDYLGDFTSYWDREHYCHTLKNDKLKREPPDWVPELGDQSYFYAPEASPGNTAKGTFNDPQPSLTTIEIKLTSDRGDLIDRIDSYRECFRPSVRTRNAGQKPTFNMKMLMEAFLQRWLQRWMNKDAYGGKSNFTKEKTRTNAVVPANPIENTHKELTVEEQTCKEAQREQTEADAVNMNSEQRETVGHEQGGPEEQPSKGIKSPELLVIVPPNYQDNTIDKVEILDREGTTEESKGHFTEHSKDAEYHIGAREQTREINQMPGRQLDGANAARNFLSKEVTIPKESLEDSSQFPRQKNSPEKLPLLKPQDSTPTTTKKPIEKSDIPPIHNQEEAKTLPKHREPSIQSLYKPTAAPTKRAPTKPTTTPTKRAATKPTTTPTDSKTTEPTTSKPATTPIKPTTTKAATMPTKSTTSKATTTPTKSTTSKSTTKATTITKATFPHEEPSQLPQLPVTPSLPVTPPQLPLVPSHPPVAPPQLPTSQAVKPKKAFRKQKKIHRKFRVPDPESFLSTVAPPQIPEAVVPTLSPPHSLSPPVLSSASDSASNRVSSSPEDFSEQRGRNGHSSTRKNSLNLSDSKQSPPFRARESLESDEKAHTQVKRRVQRKPSKKLSVSPAKPHSKAMIPAATDTERDPLAQFISNFSKTFIKQVTPLLYYLTKSQETRADAIIVPDLSKIKETIEALNRSPAEKLPKSVEDEIKKRSIMRRPTLPPPKRSRNIPPPINASSRITAIYEDKKSLNLKLITKGLSPQPDSPISELSIEEEVRAITPEPPRKRINSYRASLEYTLSRVLLQKLPLQSMESPRTVEVPPTPTESDPLADALDIKIELANMFKGRTSSLKHFAFTPQVDFKVPEQQGLSYDGSYNEEELNNFNINHEAFESFMMKKRFFEMSQFLPNPGGNRDSEDPLCVLDEFQLNNADKLAKERKKIDEGIKRETQLRKRSNCPVVALGGKPLKTFSNLDEGLAPKRFRAHKSMKRPTIEKHLDFEERIYCQLRDCAMTPRTSLLTR